MCQKVSQGVLVSYYLRSPNFRAFNRFLSVHVQTFVRSTDFRAFMFRLSCVHVQTFVRSCSDFRAFFDVFRLCNFERTTPPSCVHLRSGHTCFRLGPQPGLVASGNDVLIYASRVTAAIDASVSLCSCWCFNLGLGSNILENEKGSYVQTSQTTMQFPAGSLLGRSNSTQFPLILTTLGRVHLNLIAKC